MKGKLDDVVFFAIMGGANASIFIEALIDGRWLMAAISAITTVFCFYHGRKNYREVRNGIQAKSDLPPES